MFAKRLSLVFAFATLAGSGPLLSQTMPEHARAKAALSTGLELTVDGKTTPVTLAERAARPQKTVKVHNEHTKKDESYTGVALSDLLTKYGFAVGQPTHRKMLHSYIAAEG